MTAPARRYVAAVALLFVPLAAAAGPPGADRRCGEYCLRVALPALGFADDGTAAAVDRLGVAPSGGHALADLAAAVEAAGGHALAVETTPESLRARQAAGDTFACVAHFDGDHWALLGGFEENGQVRVIDPPTAYDLPPETLARRWDGKALLLSRNALTPEADLPGPFPWLAAGLAAAGGALLLAVGGLWWSRREPAGKRVYTGPASAAAVLLAAALPGCGGGGGADDAEPAPAAPPRAVFETVTRDAGVIPVRAGGHTFAFPLTNRGGSPLRVLGLSTSCGCTDAGVTADELAPGQTAEVRAVVTPTHPERRDATVVVRTDDPRRPRNRPRPALGGGRPALAGPAGTGHRPGPPRGDGDADGAAAAARGRRRGRGGGGGPVGVRRGHRRGVRRGRPAGRTRPCG